jgi:hypothetical protein
MQGYNKNQDGQARKSKSFLESGFGYWVSFLVLGLLTVLVVSGNAELSVLKAFSLFAGGGFFGLAILAIYNKVGSL